MKNFRWSLAPAQPLLADRLARELNISSLLAQCLLNRGQTEAASIQAFLEPRLRRLADPFLLPGLPAAVETLWRAREQHRPLVIFGDYDVDGVTSAAVLLEVLQRLGWSTYYYLPRRLDEGYGLSRAGVEHCLQQFPVSLLLAVDCGSTATDTILDLRQRGLDVVVLDHHQVSTPPPNATALVNPQLAAADSPSFRELCSVGLAFKLAHALVKRGRAAGLPAAADFDLRPLLDLVALGTIADLVPLTGENRILVACGLERLNTTRRPGLGALRRVAQISGAIGVYEVGYQLAPRLNAAGRLENAEAALRLLLARDTAEAEPLAQALDAQNRERQKIERAIADQVIGAVRARFNAQTDFVVVEGQMLWHLGVVGIVASRVLREFYRPTIILGGDGKDWRGSGRSIDGFDLAAALRQCDDLLLRHGGHAMAAGLSLAPENLAAFRQRLNQLARQTLRPEQLHPQIRLDAVACLADLALERVAELARLGPFGSENPQVNLVLRGVRLKHPADRFGHDLAHARFWVADGGAAREAVWWGANDAPLPEGCFDLAFTPEIHTYNARRSVRLKVLHWRPAV
ncbi:MAG: single-stranded-DNA-specific exonuclease RecJ [Verrucomicrobia bacterium]|nr:single-stranded-DNA-specific exonuclease RecJ [Verrucomicrobiota bacterium]